MMLCDQQVEDDGVFTIQDASVSIMHRSNTDGTKFHCSLECAAVVVSGRWRLCRGAPSASGRVEASKAARPRSMIA
jgi:hypothetical protein